MANSRTLIALAATLAVTPIAAASDDKWHFSVRPYLWATRLSGTAAGPGIPPVQFSLSFRELLESLDSGAMLAFEGHRGRYGFIFDGISTRSSESGRLPNGAPASGEFRTGTALLAGTYALKRTETERIDAILGVRYWDVRADLAAATSPTTAIRRRFASDWGESQLGVRGTQMLSDRWTSSFGAVISLEARPSYDIEASLAYRTGSRTRVVLGYRYLSLERKGPSINVATAISGPFFGFDYRF
jgi:hypothetical protein